MHDLRVSETALFARLKRKLARDGLTLHRSRKAEHGLGRFHVCQNNRVQDGCDDLERWGREHGVMREHETVAP